tara:strand:+ start:837 stop:1040 length:204 start_codon:yes stop_codon:yes gene_type:complete
MSNKCIDIGDLIMISSNKTGIFSYRQLNQSIGVVIEKKLGDQNYTDIIALIDKRTIVILEEEYEKIS